MITSYLKIALRNLFKRKGYSILNIAGLAIGITCCLLIFQYVAFERSYDNFEKDTDQIVRLRHALGEQEPELVLSNRTAKDEVRVVVEVQTIAHSDERAQLVRAETDHSCPVPGEAARGHLLQSESAEPREQILAGVRRSLRRGRLDAARETELQERVAAHRRNLVPARATTLDHRGRVDLFVAMAEEVQATVTRVSSLGAVPEAIARYLAAENLPAELVLAPDPSLDGIPWDERPLLHIRRGRAERSDAVSLTPCFAAIAETGTLIPREAARNSARCFSRSMKRRAEDGAIRR